MLKDLNNVDRRLCYFYSSPSITYWADVEINATAVTMARAGQKTNLSKAMTERKIKRQ